MRTLAIIALVSIALTPVPDGSEQVIFAGETTKFNIETYDPDGDAVAVTATGLPEWATMDGEAITASPTYEEKGQAATVVLRASDDGQSYNVDTGQYEPAPMTSEYTLRMKVVTRNRKPGISCFRQ